jgi:hypothetical protein
LPALTSNVCINVCLLFKVASFLHCSNYCPFNFLLRFRSLTAPHWLRIPSLLPLVNPMQPRQNTMPAAANTVATAAFGCLAVLSCVLPSRPAPLPSRMRLYIELKFGLHQLKNQNCTRALRTSPTTCGCCRLLLSTYSRCVAPAASSTS